MLSSCQLPYLMKSAYDQMSLLSHRVPIDEALKDPNLSAEEKRKLELAQKVKEFCEQDLGLKPNKNYTSYVKLDRPYVTYVVNASPKWELKNHEWSYPLVGKMPYKGYFREKDALAEAEEMKKEDLDVYVRGVSAYSTLGWFRDPILSSMLRYQDHDFVDTLIHETIHANIYIKNNADFNERLAVFLGGKGMEKFYLKTEGADSATLKKSKADQADSLEFSKFITEEIKSLKEYYKNLDPNERNEEARLKRVNEIKEHFKQKLAGKLQTDNFKEFPNRPLNNARLMLFGTYMEKLEDFEKLYHHVQGDFKAFMEKVKTLEGSKDPQKDLATLAN